MSDYKIEEINFLLSNLCVKDLEGKDIFIDDLCEYIDNKEVSIDNKNRIVESVLCLFGMENDYSVQESIFYFFGIASGRKILQDKIINFLLDYLSRPNPVFIEYALCTILDSDFSDKKALITKNLSSLNPLIQQETLNVLKNYEQSGIVF
jgi:hypothetical protein